MKRFLCFALSALCLLLVFPAGAHADSDDETEIINKHDSRTYMGTSSSWDDTWDADNFEDVTGEDVSVSQDLIIKGGKVGAVDVSGDGCTLTVYGGTLGSASCDSTVTLSGCTVSGDVSCNGSDLEISGSVSIGGDADCGTFSVSESGNDTAAIAGEVTCEGTANVYGSKFKCKDLACNSLTLDRYDGALFAADVTNALTVENGSNVTANGALSPVSLMIEDGATLETTGTIETDQLNGPGTLIVGAGKLTVDSTLADGANLFVSSAKDGDTAILSSSNSLDTGDVTVHGYKLACSGNGSPYQYVLQKMTGDGVSLSPTAVSLTNSSGKTVTASVAPGLATFAAGTRLKWEISDPSEFSLMPSSDSTQCTVQHTGSSAAAAAAVACYLADANGDQLTGYKDDVCLINYAAAGNASLDTTTVNIPLGCTYYVLDRNTGSAYDSYSTSNGGVVIAGTPTKAASGWLYPLVAAGKGSATVTIGGSPVAVGVTHDSAVIDTSSYTLGVGGTYTIGAALHGITASALSVSSSGACVSVAYKKTVNGTALYTIKGIRAGTATITFAGDVSAAKTAVTVKPGCKPGGVGGRLAAVV